MKLAIIAITLLLLLVPGYNRINRRDLSGVSQATQVKNAELLKLEAQLRQLDKEADSVQVQVTGDKESSGSVKIIVEREVPALANANVLGNANAAPANTNTSSGGRRGRRGGRRRGPEKTVTKKETVLNIDLSKLDIPDEYINAKIAAVLSSPTMCGEIPAVTLRQVGVSVDYEVVDDYIYDSDAYKITVFKGFRYDRASIPRLCWVFIDKDSLGNVAPLLHDLLYRHGGVLPRNQIYPYRTFTRRETDDLFLELMTKCGVGKATRQAAYQAVRKFAWFAWKGK